MSCHSGIESVRRRKSFCQQGMVRPKLGISSIRICWSTMILRCLFSHVSDKHRIPAIIHRRCLSSLKEQRQKLKDDIQALPEISALTSLTRFLDSKVTTTEISSNDTGIRPPTIPERGYNHVMNEVQIRTTVDAMLATFLLHVESRIAAMAGHGFYTIGPCGEEALSAAAHTFEDYDSVALHYRHLGINLTRSLNSGSITLPELLKDRARGYTVSRYDPVTGGVHCSIGSRSEHDYIVTSTLASQCPPAVGRALAFAGRQRRRQQRQQQQHAQDDKERHVSFVTIGDGSAHHSHFWSAFHLARHARHKRIKCPVVFGISDNGLSISYSTEGYCRTLFEHDPLVPLFQANGNDMMDVYDKTKLAMDYSRRASAPSVLLYGGLVRRFGHAATDRQVAYLTEEQVEAMANLRTMECSLMQAVEVYNALTYPELKDRLEEIRSWTEQAFDEASAEEKVTRQEMLNRVAPPAIPVTYNKDIKHSPVSESKGKKEVMRKHMTRVIDECLGRDDNLVYMGEDVEHGGYYLVTDGLAAKYKGRVIDFPPVRMLLSFCEEYQMCFISIQHLFESSFYIGRNIFTRCRSGVFTGWNHPDR